MNKYILFGLLFLASLSKSMGQTLIFSEIMQSNVDCLFEDNDFPDSWFELYNESSQSVSLSNYYFGVTPSFSAATKLSGTIPANGYAVFYCDNTTGGKHLPYRLESDTEGSVYLFTKAGKLVDSFTYPAMLAPNIAYARDEAGQWHHPLTPTPNQPNSNSFSEQLLGQPVFSVNGGVLSSPCTLSITMPKSECPSDTKIYITRDGTEPTLKSESSDHFELNIKSNTVIRAKLMSQSWQSPRSVTQSYIFLDREFNYPVVSLVTDGDYFFDSAIGIYTNYKQEWRRPVNIEIFDQQNKKTLLNQICETGISGNGSRTRPQKSLKCFAKKRFGTKHFNGRFWEDKPDVTKNKSFIKVAAVWLRHRRSMMLLHNNYSVLMFRISIIRDILRS